MKIVTAIFFLEKLSEELELVYEKNRQSDETKKKKIKLRRYLYDLLEPHYCKKASLGNALHSHD